MELSNETRTYHPNGLVSISTRIWDGVQYHWNQQVRVATPQDLEDAAITAEYFARAFGVARLEEMEEEPIVVPEGPSEGVTVPLMPEGAMAVATITEDEAENDVVEDVASVSEEMRQPSVSGGSSSSSVHSAAEARQQRTFRRRQRRKRTRAHDRRERTKQHETDTEAQASKQPKMSSSGSQELPLPIEPDLQLELDALDISDGEWSVPAIPR